jgi:Integrator complex subunit 3 N-terminal
MSPFSKKDMYINIINSIEPAMLLMERSIKYHPYITGMLVEFLRFAVDDYYPTLSGHIIKCVGTGMKDLLRKGVIKSVSYRIAVSDKAKLCD